MDISLREIDDIRNVLFKILERDKEINTRGFYEYSVFPELEYHWNKYLLAGICRTYFSEQILLINTENMYNITDFIIRKA